ncbi:TetR/AcrR family transcriptional regulator [Nocardioides marmoraquaticus]
MSRREEILAAAQRRLNFDPTSSMADVAAAAGIGRATLHRHFSGREDLLTEIGTRSLDRWEQRLDAARIEDVCSSDDPDRLRGTLVTLLGQYLEDSDDFGFGLTDQFMLTEPGLVRRGEALAEREIELFASLQSAGVLRDDVSPRWLSQACYGLLVAARDALRAGDVPRRDLDAVVSSFFLDGAAAPGKP